MSGEQFLKLFFTALGIAVVILIIATMVSDDELCQRRGGVLVRGIIGYECVRKQPMKIPSRQNLSESFQQYALRTQTPCTCHGGASVMSLGRPPWGHADNCPQYNLYLSWRGYVDQVLPGRICVDNPSNLGGQSFPDTY